MSPGHIRVAACCLLAISVLSACATATAPGAKQASPAPVQPTGEAAPSPPPAPVAETPPAPAAQPAATATDADVATATTAAPGNGLSVYESFRAGLAEPQCSNAQARWSTHFAHAPQRLGDRNGDTLALFGYVVQSLREAGLPTEFALIPFIESGYAPGARSKSGPAGLWQFIGATARHHGIVVEAGYDGRLSPAASTRAAVSYLQKLEASFDGNWRLMAMAYNAGEYRLLQGLRRSGRTAAEARPEDIKGLPAVTYAYVEKLHALACLLEQAGRRPQWRDGLDHTVVLLQARPLEDARSLDAWAARNGQDAATLRRLNPALKGWPKRGAPWALVPEGTVPPSTALRVAASSRTSGTGTGTATTGSAPATHTVRRGDSAWSIAKRHGLTPRRLLELNGLRQDSVLRPGMVLRLE